MSSQKATRLLIELELGEKFNHQKVNDICDQLLVVFKKSGETCKRVKTLTQSSKCAMSMGNLKKATQQLLEAKKIYKSAKCSKQLISVFYLCDAMIAHKFYEDFEMADSLARLGIAKWEKGKGEESTLFNLYLYAGNSEASLEQALSMYNKAYQLAMVLNRHDQELAARNAIGYAYAVNGEYTSARIHFKKALLIAKQIKSHKQLAMIYNNLAGLSQENLSDQGRYIDSAINYAKQGGYLAELQDFTANKALFYKNIGDYSKAYEELLKATELQDSLLNTRRVEAVAEMKEKYDSEKKSNEIQKLKLAKLETDVEALQYKRNQGRLLISGAALLLIAGFFAFRFVITRKNKLALIKKNREIEEARRRSDELLLNILPEEVANELKENGVAKTHKMNVSVLFTDFIDFTGISEKVDASELVFMLNDYFKEFDSIMEKYGIEKIKTNGDSYMAAGNVPVPLDDYAKKTVLAGLEMQSFVSNRKKDLESQGKPFFVMRLGIHIGPVVAGIVGVKKFQYDIWGDTVNTASRLETNGESGKVNISQSTYEYLKNDPAFVFESRGQIEAKGKGMVEMYFVDFV